MKISTVKFNYLYFISVSLSFFIDFFFSLFFLQDFISFECSPFSKNTRLQCKFSFKVDGKGLFVFVFTK